MASHDTDPHRAEPPFASDDEARTDPGEATTDEGSSAFAQSLLADLARAPLPAENVRETEGHNAAAYAVAPHRPPRANEKTIETAAVVVETTAPVPVPLPSTQETTAPTGMRILEATMPSERAKSNRRVLVASVAGAVVAAATALGIILLGGPSQTAAAPAEPQAPVPSATIPTTSTAAPPPTPSPSVAPVAPPTATASISASSSAPRPTAKPAPSARPSGTTSARPSRPSGNFAEPDRTF